MSPGKLSSQTGHAFLDAYLNATEEAPETIPKYKDGHGIKVSMKVKNLHKLLRLKDLCDEHEIPNALITDLGYTVFDGRATVTALGIGPTKRPNLDKLLKLVNATLIN